MMMQFQMPFFLFDFKLTFLAFFPYKKTFGQQTKKDSQNGIS